MCVCTCNVRLSSSTRTERLACRARIYARGVHDGRARKARRAREAGQTDTLPTGECNARTRLLVIPVLPVKGNTGMARNYARARIYACSRSISTFSSFVCMSVTTLRIVSKSGENVTMCKHVGRTGRARKQGRPVKGSSRPLYGLSRPSQNMLYNIKSGAAHNRCF